jgi:glyoxylase-like metal-dependent hydrolase (beta-lactamase superfamily II)
MTNERIIIERVVSKMFDQNTYLVWKQGESKAVAIDPGFEVESLIALIRSNRLSLAEIWITHGHADHIMGLDRLHKEFPDAAIVISAAEKPLLTDPEKNLSSPMGFPVVAPEATKIINGGDSFEVAGMHVRTFEISGHSPGSIVFIVTNQEPASAFVGDVIFQGSVGRADLMPSEGQKNMHTLISGIREKLFTLPEDTMLFPGHGPATTIHREKRMNPYVGDEVFAGS